MIIIPFLNGYFIGILTQHFQTNPYVYIEDIYGIWVEKEKLNKHLHGIHDMRSIPRIGSRIVTAPEDMSSDSIRT